MGVIVKWDEEHGYGLISTMYPPLHVRDMSMEEGSPYVSELVEFDALRDMNGCKVATNISPAIITFIDEH